MSTPKPLPSQDRLNELFDYDGLTGVLTSKINYHKRRVGKEVGSYDANGYRQIMIDRVNFKVHRIIWKMVYGTDPKIIDHIDGDPANNSLINLRSGTHLDNSRNKKIHRDGVAGVLWHKAGQFYVARIMVNRQDFYLGCGTYDECVALRKAAEQKYWNDGQAAN